LLLLGKLAVLIVDNSGSMDPSVVAHDLKSPVLPVVGEDFDEETLSGLNDASNNDTTIENTTLGQHDGEMDEVTSKSGTDVMWLHRSNNRGVNESRLGISSNRGSGPNVLRHNFSPKISDFLSVYNYIIKMNKKQAFVFL